MTTRVGYIGLGDMGGAMASNLAPKGFEARVYANWVAAAESFRLAKASGLDTEVFLQAVIPNGQLSEMQQRFIAGQKLPDEAAASEGFQSYVKIQYDAEKDLDHALELGRSCGTSLPTASLVSRDMARIYRVLDDGRR